MRRMPFVMVKPDMGARSQDRLHEQSGTAGCRVAMKHLGRMQSVWNSRANEAYNVRLGKACKATAQRGVCYKESGRAISVQRGWLDNETRD